MRVHLNNAGAGLMPEPVVAAMCSYVAEEAAQGSYETELRYAKLLEHDVYERLAEVVDASVEDLALFDSATRAWTSVVAALPLTAADRIWITPYEYAGNLILWTELCRRTGSRMRVVPLTRDGDVDLDWMARHLDEDVAVVSVPHVPSGCGIVNPVEEIGRIVAGRRCLYLVDACQSVGQVPVSVRAIGCDLLTGAGRKFLRGPRGTGFARIGPRLRELVTPSFHDLHVADMVADDAYEVHTEGARRFEYAERNGAGIAGLEAALTYHLDRTASSAPARVLRDAVCEAVATLPGVRLIDPGTEHAALVSFTSDQVPASVIRDRLAAEGIAVWVAQGSHTPLYMLRRGVEQAVRVSPHYYNTPKDIDSFTAALRGVFREVVA